MQIFVCLFCFFILAYLFLIFIFSMMIILDKEKKNIFCPFFFYKSYVLCKSLFCFVFSF